MILYVKNNLMSLRGNSFVLDENQQQVYKVKGKLFTFTHKKRIYDMNGNKLYVVKNKLFTFFKKSCYICNAEGHKIARVNNGDFNFKNKYIVMNYQDEIELEGLWRNMTIKKNGESVGKISRDITFIRDAFTLETTDEENVAFYVALCIAVDNITDSRMRDIRRR